MPFRAPIIPFSIIREPFISISARKPSNCPRSKIAIKSPSMPAKWNIISHPVYLWYFIFRQFDAGGVSLSTHLAAVTFKYLICGSGAGEQRNLSFAPYFIRMIFLCGYFVGFEQVFHLSFEPVHNARFTWLLLGERCWSCIIGRTVIISSPCRKGLMRVSYEMLYLFSLQPSDIFCNLNLSGAHYNGLNPDCPGSWINVGDE